MEKHIDLVTDINKDLGQFYTHLNEANKIMEEIRLTNEHNAAVLRKAGEIMNNQKTIEEMEKVLRQSSTPIPQVQPQLVTVPKSVVAPTEEHLSWWEKFYERGKVGEGGVTGTEGTGALESSLDSIADFCRGVKWVVENPRGVAKILMEGLSNVVYIVALVVCGGALLMRIFGHKQGMKYCPIAMVIYMLVKVVAVIL